MSSSQSCQVCGCTEDRACTTDGQPCHWVRPGLCSACARPIDKSKLNLTEADVSALLTCEPIRFQLGGVEAFFLMSALQLVCRHPDFQGQPRETAAEFALGLQERIGITPNLVEIAEAGWREEFDKPKERGSGLILPGDPRFGL